MLIILLQPCSKCRTSLFQQHIKKMAYACAGDPTAVYGVCEAAHSLVHK